MRVDRYVKVLDWIPLDKLEWSELSFNSEAIFFLEQHPDRIDWYRLCTNEHPRAVEWLEQNPDKIDWWQLARNPYAVHLLQARFKSHSNDLTTASWMRFCFANPNPKIVQFLREAQIPIDWSILSTNQGSWAVKLLEKHPEKIDWYQLSANPYAVHLLQLYPEKVNASMIYRNPHPCILRGIQDLIDSKDDPAINWKELSGNLNPSAIPMLKKMWETHPHKINMCGLSINPNIFTYDYDRIKRDKLALHKELIQTIFHPDHLAKLEQWGVVEWSGGWTTTQA
jgi:hypothetical protein